MSPCTLTSQGEEAVITGDLVHHPCQFARPDWGSSADADPAQADRTRKAFMARYADTPILIMAPILRALLPDDSSVIGDAYRPDGVKRGRALLQHVDLVSDATVHRLAGLSPTPHHAGQG